MYHEQVKVVVSFIFIYNSYQFVVSFLTIYSLNLVNNQEKQQKYVFYIVL